jgi:hypothetical protein
MSSLLSKKPNKDGMGFYKKKFDNIYFVMPKNSLNNLPDNHPYNKHIEAEPSTYFGSLNGEILDTIMDKCKEDAEDGEKSLLVIDDFAFALKRPDVINKLQEVAQNRRHYGLSVCLLVQVANSIPLIIRKMMSHCFIWRCGAKEFESIYEDFFFNVKKDEAKALCEYAWKKPFGFIFVDLSTNKYYDKNLHQLLIEDADKKEDSEDED